MFGKAIIKWLMMSSNILVALILLITLSGSIISPEKLIFPAYFSLAFPFIIVLNAAFVIFWLLVRNWFFLISLSLLFFSASQINDTFPIHFGKTKTEVANHPLRILTYNTMMSGKLKKHTVNKPNMVMQYVLDSNADIVCLQEFFTSTNDEYITHEDMIKIFKKYPYKHIQYKQKLKNKRMGIATFSKYPIVNKQMIQYTSLYNLSIFSDINVDGKMIRLINNHLESNRLTEKDKDMPILLKDKFDAENITGITLHFSRKLGMAYTLRASQADAVAKVVENSPYKVIVCGDLNDVPPSYAYTKVKGKLIDTFTEIGNGPGWSFNDRYYHFRIDYVLYDSTAFNPVKYQMDRVKYSDHYPVMCELNIKK
jgi:endonuclease/exonuclease/phosphatase family metal-dependent hydrolase